jgi:hypothetical protein
MKHFYEDIKGWSQFNDQGELLNMILPLLSGRLNIAEIGVYMGRMTAMWNVELINKGIDYTYFAIDHFLGSEEHEKGIDYFGITVSNLNPIKDNLTIIRNESVKQSSNYPDEFFDIVYLDASHDYDSVKKDIKAWYPKVRKGGILCGDDYISGWPGVVRAVDEFFKPNKIGGQQWWIQK